MWLVFATLSMLLYATADLLGKRLVDAGTERTPAELFISAAVLAVSASMALYLGGFGESGRAPWTIIASEPLLLVSSLCYGAYWLLALWCLHYLGLAVEAFVGSFNGIVFFLGVMLLNLLFGRFSSAGELLHPARLVPIVLALSGLFVLPRLERGEAARRRTVVGILVMLLALAFDAVNVLITAMIFDRGTIGLVDIAIGGWFGCTVPAVLLPFVLRLKGGPWIVPFRGGFRCVVYSGFAVMASMTYLCASSFDAVRAGLVFAAAPVFTLLGARLVLKERYSSAQNICIWTVVFAAIAFAATDYFVGVK